LGAQSQNPVIVFVDEIDTASEEVKAATTESAEIFSVNFCSLPVIQIIGQGYFYRCDKQARPFGPALKRAGRFDKKIPILLPEEDERAEIFKVMIKKYGFETDIEDFTPFAAKNGELYRCGN